MILAVFFSYSFVYLFVYLFFDDIVGKLLVSH